MDIGIIVYSKTGHTLSVAAKLQEALSAAGHAVNLEQLEATGPVSPTATNIALKASPEIEGYDALVFGAPTWGGKPAPPMAIYLEQVPSLQGVPVACLATGIFPAGWGRNQTVARMVETCESKGAVIRGTGSVGWLSFRRKQQIAEVVDKLSEALGDD